MTGVGAALSAVAEAHDVAEVALHRIRIPLLRAHRAGHGELALREVVLVRLTLTDGAVGWGECSALSHPTYAGEYTTGAVAVLKDEVLPWILSGSGGPVVGHPMAASAVVTAHVDALLRRSGTPLVERLGTLHGKPSSSVRTAAVVGRYSSTDRLLAVVNDRLSEGAALVKLKITPQPSDMANLAAVRSAWPDVPLAVDANGTLDHRSLSFLEGLDLAYVEQPAPADDLLGSARMAERLPCPVALDESATSMGLIEAALALGAGTVVNVKPARLGGPYAAAAVARKVFDAGCGIFVGGMLESGVGRAAAVAMAALPIFAIPSDLGPSSRYFERDVTAPIDVDERGQVVVPSGPGLGVVPDPAVLEQATVERFVASR